MKCWWQFVWAWCLGCVIMVAQASEPTTVDLSSYTAGDPIGRSIVWMSDPDATKHVADVRAASGQWQVSRQSMPAFGYRNDAIWLKLRLYNPTPDPHRWLVVEYPLLNQLEIFQFRSSVLVKHARGGTSAKASDRPLLSHHGLFALEIPQGQTHDILIRVQSESSLMVPLVLHDRLSLIGATMAQVDGMGLFFGAALVLMLYHIAMLVLFRDRSYFLYVLFTTVVFFVFSLLTGALDRYFFTRAQSTHPEAIPILLALGIVVGVQLLRSFLETRTRWPRADRCLVAMMVLTAIPVIITLFMGYHAGIMTVLPLVPVWFFAALGMCLAATLKGYPPAHYFVVALGGVVVAVLLYCLAIFGWVEVFFTTYALHLGSVFMLLVMGIGLMARFRVFMDEEAATRRHTMETIRLANQRLEADVNQRSRELQEENRQLTQAQKALAVQERRLASGVMSAGIAHEINNPNNFINAGAQMYQMKLEAFRHLIHDLLDGDQSSDIYKGFMRRFDTLNQHAMSVIQNSQMISEVVVRFRRAVNNDESDVLTINVVQRLRATVQTVLSGMMGRLQVDEDFSDEAEVLCNAGELSQVFVSLLTSYADPGKPSAPQYLIIGSVRDGERFKLYFRPSLACPNMKEQLSWLGALLAQHAIAIEWESDGGLIVIMPLQPG